VAARRRTRRAPAAAFEGRSGSIRDLDAVVAEERLDLPAQHPRHVLRRETVFVLRDEIGRVEPLGRLEEALGGRHVVDPGGADRLLGPPVDLGGAGGELGRPGAHQHAGGGRVTARRAPDVPADGMGAVALPRQPLERLEVRPEVEPGRRDLRKRRRALLETPEKLDAHPVRPGEMAEDLDRLRCFDQTRVERGETLRIGVHPGRVARAPTEGRGVLGSAAPQSGGIMRHLDWMLRAALAALAAGLAGWVPTRAQTPPAEASAEEAWKDTAELSYVVTGGNAEASTLGFKNKLWRKWSSTALELNAGGVRAESTTLTRTAIGTTTNFTVDEESTTSLSAESYFLNGRVDRKITEHFFWFVGAGWDRNRFAGVENRTVGVVGVGNVWIDSDRAKFRTDYSATYTDEKDVAENPNFKSNFTGARLSASLMRKIGANAAFTDDTVLDENLDETSDYRGNMTNSLTVAMSKRLALKASLQWLYRHEPAFQDVDLFDAPPPAGALQGTVPVQLKTLDTVFTTSLVINF
jgi:putative salt-induced outer membrane protein YdiY